MSDRRSRDARRLPADSRPSDARSRVISEAERDAAVARLSDAFARDVLTLEEFERRVEEVYQASTAGALIPLVQDLPGGLPSTVARGGALSNATPMAPRLAVAFGSVERGGAVIVPPRLDLRAVFGNIELDLRDAEFGPGVTELAIHAVIGNVEIRLPAHVAVENHGETFLGSFAARVKGTRRAERELPAHSSSRVRITGRAVFGNVEVEREDVGGDY